MDIEKEQVNENQNSPFAPLSNEANVSQAKTPYKYKTESGIFWFLIVFGLLFVAFILTFQVILTPIKVVGVSMQPTINVSVVNETDEIHGDIAYYSKENSLKNNDIVIVSNTDNKYIKPTDASNDVSFLIKRVIAKSGQQIKFYATNSHPTDTERLYYNVAVYDEYGNDIVLDQSYLDSEMFYTKDYIENVLYKYEMSHAIFSALTNPRKKIEDRIYVLKVPENSYFVMGDNRNDSGDSRIFGVVEKADVLGKVRLIVPYGKSIFTSIWNAIFGVKILPKQLEILFKK